MILRYASEYYCFHATCSARRGLIDSTLKTATSGYFARKLVEACREGHLA
ncbi:MAG: hypothetical protein ACTS53_02145 [Candidatus Hodgkinia cicadicola]